MSVYILHRSLEFQQKVASKREGLIDKMFHPVGIIG
jgi:hypothetical protein